MKEGPVGGLSRRRSRWPFVLTVMILGGILMFVAWPVQKIFLGGTPFSSSRRNGRIPPGGTVGFLRVEEGYAIFASRERRFLDLWEKTVADPLGLPKAREMLRNGQIVTLMPNTSVVSVDPSRGSLKILSGAKFGQVLFVSLEHVRFVTLHK
ncbi:MAG: hypothetical protein M0Z25_01200 [Nitrospiraceae bacterium]|nr:hypothetical protein [Nitrospiraceae bacterium]